MLRKIATLATIAGLLAGVNYCQASSSPTAPLSPISAPHKNILHDSSDDDDLDMFLNQVCIKIKNRTSKLSSQEKVIVAKILKNLRTLQDRNFVSKMPKKSRKSYIAFPKKFNPISSNPNNPSDIESDDGGNGPGVIT